MLQILEDKTICLTRGDTVCLQVEARSDSGSYTFQPGEVVRFRVCGKKACHQVLLQLDFPVTQATGQVTVALSSRDTKCIPVTSRPVDCWYEVELIRGDEAQTIIGYDENGPKVFRLLPEGADGAEGQVAP